ncbi:MAG TPA: nuclear transport factor 2 family protein [Longimicrobiaceae bacterium]|nr:nuclear transport factor 2 family protein [Longimicrobiaceae bacterium]
MRISPRLPSRLPPLALALLLVAAAPAEAMAQGAGSDPSRSGALYDELARMDSILFDAAFVTCSAPRVNALFRDDIEFYHDQTGLSAGEKARADFRRLTENCPRGNGLVREVVDGSLQVFPMKDDYAIQMGSHRFVNERESSTSEAMFVHLWQKKDGAWKLIRVLSFDHRDQATARRDNG